MIKPMKNALTIIGWSAASCGLTLAVLMPTSLYATSGGDVPKLEITQPRLVTGGAELTMRLLESPQRCLQLTASNPSDQTIELQPKIQLQTTPRADRMSRVPPMPRSIWSQEESITLAPREVKVIKLQQPVPAADTGLMLVLVEHATDSAVLLRIDQ